MVLDHRPEPFFNWFTDFFPKNKGQGAGKKQENKTKKKKKQS